jgi:hypothetical protein
MDEGKLAAARASANATLFVLTVAGYLGLAWQLTFPLFAFRKRLRVVLLAGGAIGCLGAVLLYSEPAFGPFYMLACLTYLTPSEWRWLTDRVAAPLQRREVSAEHATSHRRLASKRLSDPSAAH